MTKEDCIDKFVGSYWRKLSPQSAEGMKEALSEYAKQQSIAFERYINSHFCHHGDNYLEILGDGEVFTTAEIYDLFIKKQSENK
jgi:hypothetical protein